MPSCRAWSLILCVGLLGACAPKARPLGTPIQGPLPGSQASSAPVAVRSPGASPGASSPSPQASASPKALGLREAEAPTLVQLGQPWVLTGELLVPNACAGPTELKLELDEAQRRVQVVAQQRLLPPDPAGPLCPAVVSEVPASASFTPKQVGRYEVRLPVGLSLKPSRLDFEVRAELPGSGPLPMGTPQPEAKASAPST